MKKGASDMKLLSRFWPHTAVFFVGLSLVLVVSNQPEISAGVHGVVIVILLVYLFIMAFIEFLVEMYQEDKK